jgi:hypothetical protein
MEATMVKLNPWKFGSVLSLTVLINYILCTVFWVAFPGPSLDLINGLFSRHGFPQDLLRYALLARHVRVRAHRVRGMGLHPRRGLRDDTQRFAGTGFKVIRWQLTQITPARAHEPDELDDITRAPRS